MAASRVEILDVESLHTSLRPWGNPPQARQAIEGDEIIALSTSNALGGARAALIAVGLEAVAVLGFYALPHLFRLFR
jgi:hypothetical protein